MRVKNFSKSKLSFPLPPLLEYQKKTYQKFLDVYLKEVFEEVFPILDYTGERFELQFLDYVLEEPKYSIPQEARENEASYEARLNIRLRLHNLETDEFTEQEVFLCNIPLMTDKATFIINGVERVVISQLIRSPGAFFTASSYRGRNLFGAKIVPIRGAWLEFKTDASGFLGVRVNRQRKVAATCLLQALSNWTRAEINKKFKDIDKGETKYIAATLKRDPAKNPDEAVVEVYKKLRPGDLASPDAARDLVWNMFFDFQRYDLSRVGRWKMWQRLPGLQKEIKPKNKDLTKGITRKERVLHPEDVYCVMREIIRLNNNPTAEPDQIDHLGNRRVRSMAELCQDRIRLGLVRLKRIIQDRMSTLDPATLTPTQLINPKPVIGVVQRFFAASSFSQFMDAENPLSSLEHKRRLSATGPGGLTRERAGFDVRDVQSSHYGRICPIQTPEGQNVGLIGHLACFTRVNDFGFLEAPYFKVKNGKVTEEVEYLSAIQEERYSITHAGVKVDSNGKIIEKEVEARKEGKPILIERNKVDFMDVSSKQIISVAVALIPFLQNTDANRALMGANMQRQAVPLLRPEAPLIGTGVERSVAQDCGEMIQAPKAGKVLEVDANHIKFKTKGQAPEIIEYKLDKFVRTNQYTAAFQRPCVKKGAEVRRGDILAQGGAIDKGRLALGRNVLVAFMPFDGLNFEDAIVISERLSKEDVFTSVHIEDFTCDVRDTKLGPECTTCDIPNVAERKLKDLDEEGIVRIGATVGPGDILVGKISPKGKQDLTPEERLLRAIFGEKVRDVKDTSLVLEHGKEGRVVGVKIFSREQGDKLEPGVIKRIRVEVACTRKIKVGDKLSGRHGNKGVVSRILPEGEMPYLEDGTPIDIILNPLGVVSRMNIGQILETHLGWAAKKQGYLAISPALLGANEQDIKQELKKAGLPTSGKVTLYDGRTGLPFPKKITVGYIYIMKLIHMVEDKHHSRAIGPYSLITQQPLGGKAQFGGQRFGEMEVWALEGYGAAHTLQEMLTIKSDDVPGRAGAYEAILKGEPIREPNLPASFNLLVNELRALGMDVETED